MLLPLMERAYNVDMRQRLESSESHTNPELIDAGMMVLGGAAARKEGSYSQSRLLHSMADSAYTAAGDHESIITANNHNLYSWLQSAALAGDRSETKELFDRLKQHETDPQRLRRARSIRYLGSSAARYVAWRSNENFFV